MMSFMPFRPIKPNRFLASVAIVIVWLTLTALSVLADGITTATLGVTAGVPFSMPAITFETISGTQVSVTFAGTSLATGVATAQAGGEGRTPVFNVSAPTGGTVIASTIGVVGFTEPTRARVFVSDTNGAVIASCDTTTTIFAIGTTGVIVVPAPCRIPGSKVGLATGFPATIPFPFDERYFGQTRFRIDNETIWDYFNHRGGVATFGYPTSRTFLFQGYTVQFFQRRIIQLDQNGNPRLLNLLEAGLLPYTSFNGALVPASDRDLVATAPDPADAAATLAFVQTHAPNVFVGKSVNFGQTFRNTVSYTVAFPLGGNADLVPGIDLELWGIPTSAPTLDPNNHDVVFLRFQRGIMGYDASCQCTRGLLLADYLKSILTGDNVPNDLVQAAHDSPLFKQYDATGAAPNWVNNSATLPATNLSAAFYHEDYY